MTDRLYVASGGVAPNDAISAIEPAVLGGQPAVALVYAPRACRLVRVLPSGEWEWSERGGTPTRGDRNALLAEAYELRVFCCDWELRWLREGKLGRTAVLSENLDTASRLAGGEKPKEIALDRGSEDKKNTKGWLDQTYLLWGQAAEPSRDGWTKLTAARIGTLWAPVPDVPEKGHIQLHAREYLVKMDHGNVVVAHERLTHLALAPSTSGERAPQGG